MYRKVRETRFQTIKVYFILIRTNKTRTRHRFFTGFPIIVNIQTLIASSLNYSKC